MGSSTTLEVTSSARESSASIGLTGIGLGGGLALTGAGWYDMSAAKDSRRPNRKQLATLPLVAVGAASVSFGSLCLARYAPCFGYRD